MITWRAISLKTIEDSQRRKIMYDNLYCKVFLDTTMDYEELFAIVKNCIYGKKVAVTYINSHWCELSVKKNKEYNTAQYLLDPSDFIFWKYYLDIEPNDIGEREYIKKVSALLKQLKEYCNDVVAACDFEDELNCME